MSKTIKRYKYENQKFLESFNKNYNNGSFKRCLKLFNKHYNKKSSEVMKKFAESAVSFINLDGEYTIQSDNQVKDIKSRLTTELKSNFEKGGLIQGPLDGKVASVQKSSMLHFLLHNKETRKIAFSLLKNLKEDEKFDPMKTVVLDFHPLLICNRKLIENQKDPRLVKEYRDIAKEIINKVSIDISQKIPNIRDIESRQSLFDYIVKFGDDELVTSLLESGVDFSKLYNTYKIEGFKTIPLFLGLCIAGRINVLKTLLEMHKAAPSLKIDSSVTCLASDGYKKGAVSLSLVYPELVELLLSYGVEVDGFLMNNDLSALPGYNLKVKESFKVIRKFILSRVTELGDNILDKSKIDIKVLKKNFDSVKKDKKGLAKLEKDFKFKVKEILPEVDAKGLASSSSPKSSEKVCEVLLEEKAVSEPEIDAVPLDSFSVPVEDVDIDMLVMEFFLSDNEEVRDDLADRIKDLVEEFPEMAMRIITLMSSEYRSHPKAAQYVHELLSDPVNIHKYFTVRKKILATKKLSSGSEEKIIWKYNGKLIEHADLIEIDTTMSCRLFIKVKDGLIDSDVKGLDHLKLLSKSSLAVNGIKFRSDKNLVVLKTKALGDKRLASKGIIKNEDGDMLVVFDRVMTHSQIERYKHKDSTSSDEIGDSFSDSISASDGDDVECLGSGFDLSESDAA